MVSNSEDNYWPGETSWHPNVGLLTTSVICQMTSL